MAEDRDKVHKKDEEPDVEAHKKLAFANDEGGNSEDDGPDVEAHKLHHKVHHRLES